MTCRSCAAAIPEGGRFCPSCGVSAGLESGQPLAASVGATGATRVSEPSNQEGVLGSTMLFEANDIGKTVIFKAQEKKKPIFGWLVVTEGPDAWVDFKIYDEEGQVLLGKGGDCRLKLQDESLDKMHASIRLKDGRLSVTDLDTSTGTFVNDKCVTKTDLQDGDTIKVGKSSMRFRKC